MTVFLQITKHRFQNPGKGMSGEGRQGFSKGWIKKYERESWKCER